MEISKSALLEALWNAEIDIGVHWEYPYRGGYGKTCFGFTADGSMMAAFGRFLVQVAVQADTKDDGEDMANTLADHACTDSMGYETIVYFPGVTITED